jgi:hypothetical protein
VIGMVMVVSIHLVELAYRRCLAAIVTSMVVALCAAPARGDVLPVDGAHYPLGTAFKLRCDPGTYPPGPAPPGGTGSDKLEWSYISGFERHNDELVFRFEPSRPNPLAHDDGPCVRQWLGYTRDGRYGELRTPEIWKSGRYEFVLFSNRVRYIEDGGGWTWAADDKSATSAGFFQVGPGCRRHVGRYCLVRVVFKTFIPSPAVGAPVGLYGADNRSFNYTSDRYRSYQAVTVWTQPDNPHPVTEGPTRRFGVTRRYAVEDGVERAGRPWWWRELRVGATPLESDRLAVVDRRIAVRVQSGDSRNWLEVSFNLDAKNPLNLLARQ